MGWGVPSISKPRTLGKTLNPSNEVVSLCNLTSFLHRSKSNTYLFSADRRIYTLLPHHIKCLLKRSMALVMTLGLFFQMRWVVTSENDAFQNQGPKHHRQKEINRVRGSKWHSDRGLPPLIMTEVVE